MTSTKQLGAQESVAIPVEWLHRLVLIFFISIAITHPEIHPYLRWILIPVSLAGVVVSRLRQTGYFWLFLFGILGFNILFRYSLHSNHYFLGWYTTLAFCWVAFSKDNEQGRKKLCQWLLIVVFGFATLQKLLSSYFLSGGVLADYILSGGSFYYSFLKLDPGFNEVVLDFRTATSGFPQGLISGQTDFQIRHLPNLPYGLDFFALCRVVSMVILAIEGLVLISVSNGKLIRNGFTAIVILGFVWSAAAFRYEYAFYSLVLILYLCMSPSMRKGLLATYLASISIFLILDLLGLRISL